MQQNPPTPASNLDQGEVARFAGQASDWWSPTGSFAPLHRLGPARMQFIRDEAISHFGLPPTSSTPLAGLTALDIGCGGGLVCEPLARLGAAVTGIDPAPENTAAAMAHAAVQTLAITYESTTVELFAERGRTFDLVVCLEVVEHVPDVPAFLASSAALVRPGGLLILSTINRTLRALALAIVGAEYVLRWVPRGTHRWDRFVTPNELSSHCRSAGLDPHQPRGLVYHPLTDRWDLSSDTSVNYLMSAERPAR